MSTFSIDKDIIEMWNEAYKEFLNIDCEEEKKEKTSSFISAFYYLFISACTNIKKNEDKSSQELYEMTLLFPDAIQALKDGNNKGVISWLLGSSKGILDMIVKKNVIVEGENDITSLQENIPPEEDKDSVKVGNIMQLFVYMSAHLIINTVRNNNDDETIIKIAPYISKNMINDIRKEPDDKNIVEKVCSVLFKTVEELLNVHKSI